VGWGGGWGGAGGGNLSNVHCKDIWNCHNVSLPYNEYMLIKMKKKTNLPDLLQSNYTICMILISGKELKSGREE
jgi:hypothetical protein